MLISLSITCLLLFLDFSALIRKVYVKVIDSHFFLIKKRFWASHKAKETHILCEDDRCGTDYILIRLIGCFYELEKKMFW